MVSGTGEELEHSGEAESLPPLREWLRQSFWGILGIIAIAAPFAVFARRPLTAFATSFTETYGLWGVFFGILLVDVVPLLTNEPLLLAGHAGGLGFWSVLLVGSTASVLAGPLGWLIGRVIGRWRVVQDLFHRHRVQVFLHRYGFKTVAFGALPSPLPYAVSTLAAGAADVPLLPVFLGSLFRIPKCTITYLLIVFVWDVGGKIAGG